MLVLVLAFFMVAPSNCEEGGGSVWFNEKDHRDPHDSNYMGAWCLNEFSFTQPESSITVRLPPSLLGRENLPSQEDGVFPLICPFNYNQVLRSLTHEQRCSPKTQPEMASCSLLVPYPSPGQTTYYNWPLFPCSQNSTFTRRVDDGGRYGGKDGVYYNCTFSPSKPMLVSLCLIKCDTTTTHQASIQLFKFSYDLQDGGQAISHAHTSMPNILAANLGAFLLFLLISVCLLIKICTCGSQHDSQWRGISLVLFYLFYSLGLLIRFLVAFQAQPPSDQYGIIALPLIFAILFQQIAMWIVEFRLHWLFFFVDEKPIKLLSVIRVLFTCVSLLIYIFVYIPLLVYAWTSPIWFWLVLAVWVLHMLVTTLELLVYGPAIIRGLDGSESPSPRHGVLLLCSFLVTNPFQLLPYTHPLIPIGISHELVYLNKPLLTAISLFLPLVLPLGTAFLSQFSQARYQPLDASAAEKIEEDQEDDQQAGTSEGENLPPL